MKILGYNGPGRQKVTGFGDFTKGTEMEVSDGVAACFDNDAAKERGWYVKEVPKQKKKSVGAPLAASNEKKKEVNDELK